MAEEDRLLSFVLKVAGKKRSWRFLMRMSKLCVESNVSPRRLGDLKELVEAVLGGF